MRRAYAARIACAVAAAIAILPATATAQTEAAKPSERPDGYSPYERETIDHALKKVRGTVEPSPEGKILEGVDVVTLDVFEERDPLPSWATPIANWFHKTTQKYVIEREVLVAPGERYEQALIDQSARNLRGFAQLSLVLFVPLRGSAPDRVRVLVVTKDVWSLRLNSDFRFADGRLQYLLLQPSENNLLGTHQSVLGNFVMDAATIAAGASYIMPRIAGSRVRGTISASAIVNRETGKVEGSSGSLTYGQPLYSIRTKWAWGGAVSWDYQIVRRFIGGLVTDFNPETGKCQVADPKTPSTSPRRCQYRRDNVIGSYAVTRSFGAAYKNDISLGFGASRKQYRTFDLPKAFTPSEQKAFEDALVPVSDDQIGPYVEWSAYTTSFFDVLDLDSLALTESYRKGHDVTVRVAPVLKAFNSSRNFVDVSAAALYTWPLGDGMARVGVTSATSLTTNGVPDGSILLTLRIATPRFGRGRLVFDTRFLDRYANYLNAKSTLGNDGRLRGYPANMFIGKNLWSANLEYRSDPVEIKAVQLGFVLFADAGDAFETFREMHIKQSCGFGLRAVFPQLQRYVLRADLGFPLTPNVLPAQQYKADLVVTFNQAF